MVAAGQEIAARLDEAAQAEDELSARVEAVAADAAAARSDAETARSEVAGAAEEAGQALAAAREASERVAEVDRSTANVLADVRGVRDRVDEAATLARTAQDAAATARTETDELRGSVARVAGELQVARGELERAGEEALGARQAASTAQEAASAAREDAGRAREESAAIRREVETGRERLTTLGAGVERLTDSVAHAAQAAESAQTEATAARRNGKELAQLVSDLDSKATALRGEMGTGRERLQALDASVNQLGQAAMIAARTRRPPRPPSTRRARSSAPRSPRSARSPRRPRPGSTRSSPRSRSCAPRPQRVIADADTNRDTVVAGERRLEAMAAEVTFALKSLEEIKAGLTSAGQAAVIARREAEQAKKAAQNAGEGSKDNVTEVFAQLLGLAAKKGQSGVHRRPSNPATKKAGAIKREPRHGFDDAAAPMATLSLEGKFRELNPAFAKLVGYQEHEFGKAAWPSPHDRSVYEQQQEQLTQLASGEIESVIVQSTYMHGQGLMVPVVGTLKAVPGEDGLPLHLLLEAEDRHTS